MAEKSARAGYRFRRQKAVETGVLCLALAIALITTGHSSAHADQTASAIIPLNDAARESGAEPVRFVLASGKTVIGRIAKADDDVLTIRRPSGGLAQLRLIDIVAVNIKSADGDLRRGTIARLPDDGGIGWLADGDDTETTLVAGFEGTDNEKETGGPLIRVDQETVTPNMPNDPAAKETVGLESIAVAPPTVDDTPETTSEPVRLSVTADEVSEQDRLIYFRLRLSEPAPRSIPVIYTMLDGSAAAPGDYSHRQGVLVFEPGQKDAAIATNITDDEIAEDAESFTFFVTADPATVLIEERKTIATIADDDG